MASESSLRMPLMLLSQSKSCLVSELPERRFQCAFKPSKESKIKVGSAILNGGTTNKQQIPRAEPSNKPKSWPEKTTNEQHLSLTINALHHDTSPEALGHRRLSPGFSGGIYSSWYTDQYYKKIWRDDVSHSWGLTPRKSLERMFNEAANRQTPFITIPLTTQKLDLSTIKAQKGSQILFRFNQSEYIADCKLGIMNGRSVRTSSMADVVHAACTFAFGA